MKKICTLLALAMVSAMSWAAVSITVTPDNVDFGTVTMLGHESTGVEGSITFDVTYSGLQPYSGVVFEDVEMPEEDAAFWISGTNTAGWIYGGDEWNDPEGQGLTLNYYATAAGTYTGKIRFYSYTDAYWEVESPSVYMTMTLKVIDGELPKVTLTRINSTSELKEGDVVMFVNEDAGAVSGTYNGETAYIPYMTEDVTIDKAAGTARVLESAQMFTLSKYSGNWQFTTTDTGKRLHLDVSGKGAFTFADTQAGTILAGWGISISNGVAEVSKPDGTFPVEFNADRFKPYKNAGSGTSISLYKKNNPSTDVEQVQSDLSGSGAGNCTKVLRDGKILIIRNGATYDLTGRRVE